MVKKFGFSLIEILISVAISGILLTALYNVLSQTNNAVTVVERISSIDESIFLLQNQLEKDLSGAFVVFERRPKKEGDKKTASGAQEKAGNSGDSGKNNKSGESKAGEKKQEYEEVAMKNCFYSKNGQDNIDTLSFLTNNPLKTFSKPTSLIKRVTYKLVRVQERGNAVGGNVAQGKIAYKLLRQESDQLDFKTSQNAKAISYELVNNIKKLNVEYIVTFFPEEKKDGAQAQSGQDGKNQSNGLQTSRDSQEKKVEYKKFKVWTDSEIKKTKRNRPDFCKFTVELWDKTKRTFKSFEIKIYIYAEEQKLQPKTYTQRSYAGLNSGQAGKGGAGSGGLFSFGNSSGQDSTVFNNRAGNNRNNGMGAGSGQSGFGGQYNGRQNFGQGGNGNTMLASNNYGQNGQNKRRGKSVFNAFLSGGSQ